MTLNGVVVVTPDNNSSMATNRSKRTAGIVGIFVSLQCASVVGFSVPSTKLELRESSLWSPRTQYVSNSLQKVSPYPRARNFLGTTDKVASSFESIASDGEEEKQQQSAPKPPSLITNFPDSKFRRLKDMMWIRETLEDLTAAEFACKVEAAGAGQADSGTKRKRAVDYEKMLGRLNGRIRDMVCYDADEINGNEPIIIQGKGMGRIVYTHQQRDVMFKRVLSTRKSLMKIIKGNDDELEEGEGEGGIFSIKIPELNIPKDEESAQALGPKLYVRDDGTVDWDGALQDRAALKQFGSAVWARINGQTPTSFDETELEEEGKANGAAVGGHAEKPAVTAKIEDTPAIREARDELNRLSEELKKEQFAHTALLSSAISAGQAVANVNLASLDSETRTRIRESGEALDSLQQLVSFNTLVYELERIYSYLSTELFERNTGYIPLQERLNVAEFGLLESQIETFHRELEAKGRVDADILAVVMEQLTDFKRRLGIDYYVQGLTYDREAIQTWLNDLLRQTKSGLMFYVKGIKLFWNDILYCSSLIGRAAQGYTLKPREVSTIRRTFKDIITFIPVLIILIIPMTPVGHVLVFGAIQRFFPGFFPSCFTEQRQNLLQLYETTEFSEVIINENFKEKTARFFEALAFMVASQSRSAFNFLETPRDGTARKDGTEKNDTR